MAEVFGNDHHEEHDVTRNNLTVDYFKVLLQVLCVAQDCDDVILAAPQHVDCRCGSGRRY